MFVQPVVLEVILPFHGTKIKIFGSKLTNKIRSYHFDIEHKKD